MKKDHQMNFKTPKCFYFRDLNDEGYLHDINHVPVHSGLPGSHAKDQRLCKACVTLTICVIQVSDEYHVGASFRNPIDQFNKERGRMIAFGRAESRKRKASRFAGIFNEQGFENLLNDLQQTESELHPWDFQDVVLSHIEVKQ